MAVLSAALDAHREGRLAVALAQHPAATAWLVRHFLGPILRTAGDALEPGRAMADAAAMLLGWAASRARPDGAPELVVDDRAAWLDRTSWRPALAVMCHYGFARIPDFRDRYYRRPDESPAETLCGLWNIGQSTFYRHLERGKALAVQALLEHRRDRRHGLSIREFAQRQAYVRLGLDREAAQPWHLRQAADAAHQGDALSALWHFRAARHYDRCFALIQRHVAALAGEPELEHELQALEREVIEPRGQVALLLTEAAVRGAQGRDGHQGDLYTRALRAATSAGDALAIGVAYSHLGKYHEPRDFDRAFACYQDSVDFLRRANLEAPAGDVDLNAREEYVGTLTKLAWLYALRNDPRALAVLERADAARERWTIGDEATALLEQAWGEYHRRAGDLAAALEHKQRALNVYERLGDQQGILKTYVNLGLIHADRRDFDVAIRHYRRVLELAERFAAGPEVITSTHLNLGASHYWLGDYDAAIAQYQRALQLSVESGLSRNARWAYFNLAEAHYTRFGQTRDAADEEAGDHYRADARRMAATDNDPAFVAAVDAIKDRILGEGAGMHYDRLIAAEQLMYPAEAQALERERAVLAMPGQPEDHIRAHLVIARAHLAIGAREREAALSLIETHGLSGAFAAEIRELRDTYERELSREERLAALWKAKAADVLAGGRLDAVLGHVLQRGWINKSAYAAACDVGLATASKHLARLTELGLLRQEGRGPSTRYVLA